MNFFTKLCDPAKAYILLSLLALLMYFGNTPKNFAKNNIVFHVASIVLWVIILNWICTLKYGVKVSWFLVFFPIIFMIIMMILLITLVDELDISKQEIKEILDEEDCDKCN